MLLMILCPFCAYLNGYTKSKPKKESYYHEYDHTVPYGFVHIEDSGAVLTNEFKLHPRKASDLFDKPELQIVDEDIKKTVSHYFKILCDICIFDMILKNECIVLKELEENEKLFRLYMRNKL